MARVSEGTAKTGGRKTPRQKETGGRTGRIGAAAAGTPGGGYSPPCITRPFRTKHHPALSEGTGARGKSGVEQTGSARTGATVPPLQALAGQAESFSCQSLALSQADSSGRGSQEAETSQNRNSDLALCRLPGNGQKAFPGKDGRITAGCGHCPVHALCRVYTVQEVANELYRHAPRRSSGQSPDERTEYGRRVIGYAFGMAGEIDIANVQPTEEQINNFVQEVEQDKERIPRQSSRLRMK